MASTSLIFNLVQNYQVNICLLDKILSKLLLEWPNFLKEEFKSVVKKYSNFFTPEPDYIFQRYLKVVDDNKCLFNIINIANTCINFGHQSLYFKMSTLIIIPKLNKVSYNSSKMFCPIILLNTLEKLIKNIIREKLQYQFIASNFIHSNQLNRLKQHLITNVDRIFTYLIYLDQIKGLQTSILAFDIAQFFSLLNLIDRKIQYI